MIQKNFNLEILRLKRFVNFKYFFKYFREILGVNFRNSNGHLYFSCKHNVKKLLLYFSAA